MLTLLLAVINALITPNVCFVWPFPSNFENSPIIYSANGKCIGIDNSQDLYIYDCDGEDDQAWSMLDLDGTVTNAANAAKFLEADGAWPKLRTYTGAANQKWELISSGAFYMIKNEQNCLRKADNSDRLKVEQCGSNDQWAIAGSTNSVYINITSCDDWSYGTTSNTLTIQLKGSKWTTPFIFLNKIDTLPINGESQVYKLDVDYNIGDLYSVII
eukprot:512504_1